MSPPSPSSPPSPTEDSKCGGSDSWSSRKLQETGTSHGHTNRSWTATHTHTTAESEAKQHQLRPTTSVKKINWSWPLDAPKFAAPARTCHGLDCLHSSDSEKRPILIHYLQTLGVHYLRILGCVCIEQDTDVGAIHNGNILVIQGHLRRASDVTNVSEPWWIRKSQI